MIGRFHLIMTLAGLLQVLFAAAGSAPVLVLNDVPSDRRLHWMKVAHEAIYVVPNAHPCPAHPFGTAIVNTTSDQLVCIAANQIDATGDPTLHGEIAGIRNCTNVLAARGLSPAEISAAWRDFSLYTNGEPCAMCGSAIRWAGFKELIYATSANKLVTFGWVAGVLVDGSTIWEKSNSLPHGTSRLGDVLAEETDPFFQYQYNETAACPIGCQRRMAPGRRVATCTPVDNWREVVRRAGKGLVAGRASEVRDEL